MYLIDVARVTRSVKRNGYCSVKKKFTHRHVIESIVWGRMSVFIARKYLNERWKQMRAFRRQKRGKKQINHFWAVQPANKIWNDKESYEVKRSERLTFHFSIFFPSWFFSTVSQYVARNPPESRKKFKIEHFYDNHRIDFFFTFFPFILPLLSIFVASTHIMCCKISSSFLIETINYLSISGFEMLLIARNIYSPANTGIINAKNRDLELASSIFSIPFSLVFFYTIVYIFHSTELILPVLFYLCSWIRCWEWIASPIAHRIYKRSIIGTWEGISL